jgi:hypothetical protein
VPVKASSTPGGPITENNVMNNVMKAAENGR